MIANRFRLGSLSLNQRIMLIVLVALLPLSLIGFAQGFRAREHLNQLAGERLAASANATAANQREGFNITRRMLARAANDRAIVDAGEQCPDKIRALLFAQRTVINLARSDSRGAVQCSGLPFQQNLTFAEQDWWQKGKQARRLTVSAPIIGQISQRQVVVAMLPLYTGQGDYAGAITAAIDVSWLENALTNLRLSSSAQVGIVNADGDLLMQSAGFDIGEIETKAVQERFRIGEAADGSQWVYHVAPIFGQDLFVVFAEPQKRLLSIADEFWIHNLLLPLGTMFFASLAVWWGIQLFVVRWLDRLSVKATSIAQGTYRYEPHRFDNAAPEIADFARTLHRMAEDIEIQRGEIATSLAHSRALTKEINHRVKNNLQIILSLLHMQGAQTREPEARHIINQTLARMGAVAAAQRLTYEEGGIADAGQVDMCNLLTALAQQLRSAFQDKPHILKLVCDINNFPADLAIPVSLIVVEAVFNAMTHAFETSAGEIIVSLYPDGTDTLLSIRDNGRGYDLTQTQEKLGLDLMRALAIQLNGTLSIITAPGNGSEIQIRMPLRPMAES